MISFQSGRSLLQAGREHGGSLRQFRGDGADCGGAKRRTGRRRTKDGHRLPAGIDRAEYGNHR